MHRSGSSLTANLLQRLGASLGPFELSGPGEANPHGHFEAIPVNQLNMEVQQRVFGFDGDMPLSEDDLRRFRECDGRWSSDQAILPSDLARGHEQIRQLVESSPVCGLKDPRMLLLWPYWVRVLNGFPGLRVVLLTLVRSPHEIAMSIFLRGKGNCAYHDALSATAVNLRRLQEIRRTWRGEQVLVRFDPRTYAEDMRSAAKVCGLTWQDAIFQEVFDPVCRHHHPTRVDHEAQRIFDEISGLPPLAAPESLLALARDAASREKLIQRRLQSLQAAQQRQQVAGMQSLEQRLAARLLAVEQQLVAVGAYVGLRPQKGAVLSESSCEPAGEIQSQRRQQQLFIEAVQQRQMAIEAMERRWKRIESHPLYGAVRRLFRFTWKWKLAWAALFKAHPRLRRRLRRKL